MGKWIVGLLMVLLLCTQVQAETLLDEVVNGPNPRRNVLVTGLEDGTTDTLRMLRFNSEGGLKVGLVDESGYQYVNVASGGFVGSTTPSDAFTNPTTASVSYSLMGGYNSTGWDLLRTAYADNLAATGVQACGLVAWDGTAFDRVDKDANDALYVNPGALDADTDDASILPHPDVVSVNITTATSTTVKASAGDFLKLVVGVAGAASTTAILYNDADCASLPAAILTIDTSTTGIWPLSFPFAAGMCVVTSGTPNIAVFYR